MSMGVYLVGSVPGPLVEALRRCGFTASRDVGLVVIGTPEGLPVALPAVRARFPRALVLVVSGRSRAARTEYFRDGADMCVDAAASAVEYAAHLRALMRRGPIAAPPKEKTP